jgi:hypothetical protein
MVEINKDCEAVRKELRERVLECNPPQHTPPWASQHLKNCLSCRNYQEGLGLAFALFDQRDFYSLSLRQSTLARIQNAAEDWDLPKTILVVIASLISAQLSFLLPMWLLSFGLRALLDSSLLSLVTSFILIASLGIVTVLACSLMLLKSGFMQQNSQIFGLLEENHG